MQAVAIGWLLYELTGSALDLGLVGLAQFLPMLVLTFVVGQVADRFDRRRIVAICQILHGCAASVLLLGMLGGWLNRELVFAIVTLVGGARAFEGPTMAALVPGLVPRALLPRATAWAASANQTAQILGPALGGLLYGLGPIAAFATACLCFCLAALCTGLIRSAPVERSREPVTLQSVFSGLGFIRGRPLILGTLSLDLFAVLLGGATALLPIYARDILQTGPSGLGLLRSGPAIGALAMSILLAYRPLQHHVGPILFGAVTTFGLATIVFGLSRWLPLSFAALIVLGASDVVSVVIRFSLVQFNTPDGMRGRVSAINSMFVGTSNQLGDFESGLTAALLGTVPAVLLGGIGTIIVAALWMYFFPELRRLRTLDA